MRTLVLSCLAVFATIVTSSSIANPQLAGVPPQLVRPEEIETELIKDLQGKAISVIGHYDVGLDKSSSRAPARVEQAVKTFVLNDRKLFGLSGDTGIRFAVTSIDDVDKNTVVAQLNQFVGELRVLDSDLTAVFAADGFLQSLNGGIVPDRDPQARPSLTLRKVLDLLKDDAKAGTMGDLSDFQDSGRNRWRRKDGATIEAGWSRHHQAAVWKATLPEEIIWIDDKTGTIVRRQSQREYGPTQSCDIRHLNWPRAGDGRATSLAESTTTTMRSTITCEADEWFGTCYWHLKRQPVFFPHGIARIDDVNGGEREDQQSCGSSSMPSFTASSTDALHEQGAFYTANQMRFFVEQNVWNQVAPNRDANVDIHVDDNGVVNDNGGPSAYFNDFWTTIRAHPDRSQQQVFMHEYGHYVVWTYDDVSQNCEQGSDEGNALDETLGNVFAGLYARDSRDIDPRYGAYSGLTGAPSPHTDADSILLHDVNCSSGDDPHSLGEAFEQAVWELLYNRDCTVDNCTGSSGHGNRIWVGAGRDTVTRHVGAALGFALRNLGQNITHSQVAAQMIVKITGDSGRNAGRRARAVFVHHGVL